MNHILSGRGEGSRLSQDLVSYSCVYLRLRLGSFENDQNQPLVNIGRKKMY